jgi:cytochrome c553
MRNRSLIVQSCAVALLCAGTSAQSVAPRADRAAFMQQHFTLVMAVHEAVIRGDVKTARSHAQTLANRPDPPGLPAAAAPYLATMKAAAAGLATADEIEDASSATASMLALCGDCHRAVGTMPAPAPPQASAVGGAVGHMLAHKRAIDLMVQGLTVPSASLWRQGAEALGSAPLRREALPRDPKLTKEILETEQWVHQMADRARQATDVRSQIYVYSELIESCGTCHGLHGNVWGPDKR